MRKRSFKRMYKVLHLAKMMILDTRQQVCDFANLSFVEAKLILATRGLEVEPSVVRESLFLSRLYS